MACSRGLVWWRAAAGSLIQYTALVSSAAAASRGARSRSSFIPGLFEPLVEVDAYQIVRPREVEVVRFSSREPRMPGITATGVRATPICWAGVL